MESAVVWRRKTDHRARKICEKIGFDNGVTDENSCESTEADEVIGV